jgi:hypothetical protein
VVGWEATLSSGEALRPVQRVEAAVSEVVSNGGRKTGKDSERQLISGWEAVGHGENAKGVPFIAPLAGERWDGSGMRLHALAALGMHDGACSCAAGSREALAATGAEAAAQREGYVERFCPLAIVQSELEERDGALATCGRKARASALRLRA